MFLVSLLLVLLISLFMLFTVCLLLYPVILVTAVLFFYFSIFLISSLTPYHLPLRISISTLWFCCLCIFLLVLFHSFSIVSPTLINHTPLTPQVSFCGMTFLSLFLIGILTNFATPKRQRISEQVGIGGTQGFNFEPHFYKGFVFVRMLLWYPLLVFKYAKIE